VILINKLKGGCMEYTIDEIEETSYTFSSRMYDNDIEEMVRKASEVIPNDIISIKHNKRFGTINIKWEGDVDITSNTFEEFRILVSDRSYLGKTK
jgi:hypothetical protein